ncbi:MAG: type II secretion system protein GspM [Candidatus Rifleibacteriota bacterium]
MEKLNLWWQKRPIRDRRALSVLAIFLPVILCWYLVTVPLQDRLKMAQRVLETRRNEATEVQKLLQEYALLKAQLDGYEFKADNAVVPELEQAFRELNASDSYPVLSRARISIFGKDQPAAQVRLDAAQPQTFWNLLSLVASSGVYLAEFEVTGDDRRNQLSTQFKAWLPARN